MKEWKKKTTCLYNYIFGVLLCNIIAVILGTIGMSKQINSPILWRPTQHVVYSAI